MTLSKQIDDLKFDKKLKVAILSSFTINGLDETIHVKCSELGIRYQSFVSGYNQYNQELLEPNSNYYNFSPDVTFLILDIRNFLGEFFYKAYRELSKICDYPLHLGVTEAGSLFTGSIKSSIGIGQLLMEGIGDTIRVSLSSDPIDEIKAGYEILKSLGIRSRGVNIISCPSCARQAFPVIETVKQLEEKLSHIKEPISLSIIGCVVNGPGEAAQTEIGLTGGGQDNNLLYLSGIPHNKVPSSEIIEKVVQLVEEKVKNKK